MLNLNILDGVLKAEIYLVKHFFDIYVGIVFFRHLPEIEDIPRYGRIKYEEYCKRQAYTCSKEYMMNEKGFTEDDWKKYNKLRSSTKENFIIRYGK